MHDVRVMILRAAGTNCDLECEHAWRLAGAAPERVHIRRLIERPALLDDYQILTIPGGFSYGDDIAAGRIFALQLEQHLLDDLRRFVARGRLILGICNGFQVLVKAGLLPYSQASAAERVCTVTYNDPAGFQDRWVWLRADSAKCAFLEPGRVYEMPIAHGEGRVVFRDAAALEALVESDQCAMRYIPAANSIPDTTVTVGSDAEVAASTLLGAPAGPGPNVGVGVSGVVFADSQTSIADRAAASPHNPNGSTADLAGLCDETGRVFGLMPHPDRFTEWMQHPCWTSLPERGEGDGLAVFRRAVDTLR